MVPVDYVVEAIAAAAALPEAEGETLHLVDPEPLTASELVGARWREHYGGRAPQGRIPPAARRGALRIPAGARARSAARPRESIPYLNHPVVFDTRRTVDLLGAHGLTPPTFADYAEPMVRFFKEHEDDPAFAPAQH